MTETGVLGEFRASHDDPRGQLPRHWHTYEVEAWFPAGSDGRDWRDELDRLLRRLDGRHLQPEYAWGEQIADLIGTTMLDCVEVLIRRPGERLLARWRRPVDARQPAACSQEKRLKLKSLYLQGLTYRAIAAVIGGTADGVRSTVRKMRERGDLPPKPRERRQ